MVAEQCLHSMEAFCACTALPMNGLGVHEELGGDTSRTGDPHGPRGYARPHGIISVYKTSGGGRGIDWRD